MAAAADTEYMRMALELAQIAADQGEVPVGAIVVWQGRVVGRGRNASIRLCDPTAHAEILALRAAGVAARNYRLPDAELFVTVEPCLMCVGAVIQARLRRVVFGCADPKAGALGSIADFSADPRLNHRFVVEPGIGAAEARVLLQRFFRERRER